MNRFLINFFAKRSRIFAIAATLVLFVGLYYSTNHLNLVNPRLLPLLGFELTIPFIPWTIFVYLSAILLIFIAILLIGRNDLGRAMAGLVMIMFVCALIFLFLPTTYPRPEIFPSVNPASQIAYRFLTAFDSPRNCFPSQHIAMCIFAAFAIYHSRKTAGIIFFIWAAFIALSTLTLKQHYFLDLIGGLAFAVIVWKLVFNTKLTAKSL